MHAWSNVTSFSYGWTKSYCISPGYSHVTIKEMLYKEASLLRHITMLTVSLVCGIVMPRTTSYALNDNIQLKYLGYFHDISLYLGISLIIFDNVLGYLKLFRGYLLILLSHCHLLQLSQWSKKLIIDCKLPYT